MSTIQTRMSTSHTKLPEYQELNRVLNDILSSHVNYNGQRFGYNAFNRFELDFDEPTRRISCTTYDFRLRNEIEVAVDVEWSPIAVKYKCGCKAFKNSSYCEHVQGAIATVRAHLIQRADFAWDLLSSGGVQLWRSVLLEIDDQMSRLKVPAHPEEPTGPSPVARRIAWRIRELESGLDVQPSEQQAKPNGNWTKGKKLNWYDYRSDETYYSSPEDLKVFVAICQMPDQYGGRFDFHGSAPSTFQLLKALIGHPRVFHWDTGAPLEICEGQFGFGVDESAGSYRVTMTCDNVLLPNEHLHLVPVAEGFIVLDRAARSLKLLKAPRELVQLAITMINRPAEIPEEGRAELMQRVTRLEAAVPVRMPERLMDGSATADGRMVLKLGHVPSGLTVELRVHPAENGGYYLPGEGPAEFTASIDGKRLLYQRNLVEERQNQDRLTRELKLAAYPGIGPGRWQITGEDEVLDFLGRFTDRSKDDPVVVWQEASRPLEVVGAVEQSSMKFEIEHSRDWFGLTGTIDVGGTKVPLQKLLAALRLGRRYVELEPGKWAAIAEDLRDRLAALSDVLHRNRSKLEFDATAAPIVADFIDDQTLLKAARAWKQALKRLDEATKLDPHPPATLTAELRDYQLDGYKWLRKLAAWGVGGCLADDMGLGKTVQALAVLIDRMEEGPSLVVAPVSVGFNWVREAEKFAPTLKPVMYRDTDRAEFLSSVANGDVIITSYQLLLRDAEHFQKIKWGTLVLDEAQFIKNSRTKTAAAVRDVDAKWRIALTGTPMENHLGELWSIFRAVAPGLFGAQERFRERFSDPIEKEKNPERRVALARTIRPFVLRRTKSEVLSELPPRTEIVLNAELSAPERQLYEDARLWAVTNLTGVAEQDQRFQVLAALTRLRQLACHPALVKDDWTESSAKLELFLETVEELREGAHRALVFSQFTAHLALVRTALDKRGVKYQYLDGQTPEKLRRERVEAFQRGEGDLFLISLKAGGTGLNLTAADYVIHLDPWWNPAVEDQASDRAHRIGQTRPVTVYRLVAKDTIEEQILSLHAEKRTLVSSILEGSDQAGRLSTQELIDLIRTGTAAEKK